MFLKNKNIIFKIRRSKVTDYAALSADASMVSITDTLGQQSKTNPPSRLLHSYNFVYVKTSAILYA